jgi:transcriptional regulator with XRE-family HTH domain/KaiC/GvpD/RAD55 family RecA-like ATPase
MVERLRVASGVSELDRILGGLYIGDNVVWHDDAGSLASPFYLNFLQASQVQNKPFIYVSFDRSPRNLVDKLGPLAENPSLTILDCFSHGKGEGSPIFLKFYEEVRSHWHCRLVPVEEPREISKVMDALYAVHGAMHGDVRFIFESITGMQELWGSEEEIINFYSRSCPRLYELNTIAYWILEKRAHSPRLRAQINQIAQVAIDLSVNKGTTSLTILKAEKRTLENLHKPQKYWTKDLVITFDSERRTTGRINLDFRLKELRTKKGLSQTELAKQVGVTPSTISQVESNLIYPSVPLLLKMAQTLSVKVSSFFQETEATKARIIFPAAEALDIKFHDMPEKSIYAKLLTPLDLDRKVEPYLIEISPNIDLPSHFFFHKGEEIGFLMSGKLQFKLENAVYTVRAGDVIYLTTEMPTQWRNPGPGVARLLWMKVK